jgi:hypothetical protein
MNENIEEWEKEKLKKLKLNNPEEYKKEFAKQEKRKIEIKKKQKKNISIYTIVILFCFINSILSGPPFLYIIFGLIPYIIKKLSN